MHKHCEDPQKPIGELVAVLQAHRTDKQWRQATEDLRQAASGCPACMLAAIRQSGMQGITADCDGVDFGAEFEFNFKEELKAFWAEVNDRQARYE